MLDNHYFKFINTDFNETIIVQKYNITNCKDESLISSDSNQSKEFELVEENISSLIHFVVNERKAWVKTGYFTKSPSLKT